MRFLVRSSLSVSTELVLAAFSTSSGSSRMQICRPCLLAGEVRFGSFHAIGQIGYIFRPARCRHQVRAIGRRQLRWACSPPALPSKYRTRREHRSLWWIRVLEQDAAGCGHRLPAQDDPTGIRFVVGKIELVALNDAFYPTYSRKRSKDGVIGIHLPASLFLPNGPTRLDVANRSNQPHDATPPSLVTDVIEPPAVSPPAGAAVEVEVRVPPSGETKIRSGRRCSAPGIRNLWMFRVQRL
jgi:hypothetical protein